MRRMRDITRPTVERLSADNLDIRELKRFGLLQDCQTMLRSSLRWPALSRIVGSRCWLELEFGRPAGPRLLDSLSFRWLAAVDALPALRNPRGKASEWPRRLLLPRLHRKSFVRLPDQKHARPAPFRDLQDQAAAQRLRLAFRAVPGAAAWDAPKEI
jgi:hypothetical protein